MVPLVKRHVSGKRPPARRSDEGLVAVGGELQTLRDGRGELDLGGLEHLLLVLAELAEAEVLLPAALAQLERGGEPLKVGGVALDVSALDDALLAVVRADQGRDELGTGHTHGEGGGSGASLGVDDLGAAVLDAVRKGLDLLLRELVSDGRRGLRDEREDGGTGVAADDGDVDVVDADSGGLGHEGVGTHDVEGGDTEHAFLVVDAVLLQDLGEDRDGRVDRVGDDGHLRVGAVLGDGVGEVSVEGGVDGEQVLAGHTGLAGHAGWDDDDVGVLEGGVGSFGLGGGLLVIVELVELGEGHAVAGDGGCGVDVAEVSRDAGSSHEVEDADVRDERVHLQEHGEGLADAAGSADDGHTGVGRGRRRDGADGRLGGGGGVAGEHRAEEEGEERRNRLGVERGKKKKSKECSLQKRRRNDNDNERTAATTNDNERQRPNDTTNERRRTNDKTITSDDRTTNNDQQQPTMMNRK